MTQTLELFPAASLQAQAGAPGTLSLPNDADPCAVDLTGIDTVVLHFPVFSDGRAFSQAFLLRRRLGFSGAICASGDVLIDQLQHMQRSGFSQAVLRADQDLAHGRQLLALFAAFYQGDAVQARPRFATAHA